MLDVMIKGAGTLHSVDRPTQRGMTQGHEQASSSEVTG